MVKKMASELLRGARVVDGDSFALLYRSLVSSLVKFNGELCAQLPKRAEEGRILALQCRTNDAELIFECFNGVMSVLRSQAAVWQPRLSSGFLLNIQAMAVGAKQRLDFLWSVGHAYSQLCPSLSTQTLWVTRGIVCVQKRSVTDNPFYSVEWEYSLRMAKWHGGQESCTIGKEFDS